VFEERFERPLQATGRLSSRTEPVALLNASQPVVRLLFFSGSSRVGSVNARLARAAADLTRRTFGASVTMIDLADFHLPDYAGYKGRPDDLPGDVVRLRALLADTDGLFLSSDEYTGAYSTLFRNAVGWLMDERGGAQPLLRGKPVALCGASIGGAGALRGQPALKQFLQVVGMSVISQQLHLGTSRTPFDAQGSLLPKAETQLINGCLGALLAAATSSK
jgi:NAD(P)H-dependent FMN reductase